ncbi:putative methyltransferase-domain-containing protein [Paraphysoderma sedebokerense]|nr:putative methyltransferase-domain-containing protein [Paraphysoderma sedebokerense]
MAMDLDSALALMKRQYACNRPLHMIHFPSLADNISWVDDTVQCQFLHQVIHSPQLNNYPPAQTYTVSFMKKYIRLIEDSFQAVNEELIQYYCEIVTTAPKRPEEGGSFSTTYKTYFLDPACKSYVTVKEDQSTLGGGTTGLRTWAAGLHMIEYLLQHPESIRSKKILELGSGVGLVAMVCAHLDAKSIIATDCDYRVLNRIRENVEIVESNQSRSSNITITKLDWESFIPDELSCLDFDMIICSDVTYDDRIIPPLLNVISNLVRLKKKSLEDVEILVAATIRREDTFGVFEHEVHQHGFKYTVLKDISSEQGLQFFFHDEEKTKAKIMKIEKRY